jgi:hypothetical protein
MIDLYDELHRVVRALDGAGVAYALVGGLALSLHARARSTDDIDVLIAERDLGAATTAIRPSGYEARMAPFTVAKGRLRIQRYLKTVGAEIVLVDALLAREAEHTEMLERAISMDSDSGRLRVVTRDDLRTLKRMRGSPQDLADLAALDAGESDPS